MLSCGNENTVSVNDDKTNEDASTPSDNIPNIPSTAKISVKSNVPYEICIYTDSERQNLVARIPANESAILETEQIGEAIFYYTFFISPESDSAITIPFYDNNCTFKLATSADEVAVQTISSPKSISLSSCFVVLKNESKRAVQLMNEGSAISPYKTANTTSAFISPSESACYEIKEKNFDNIGSYSVEEALGNSLMPLADIIPAFERCKIYMVVYDGKSIQLANTIGQEELIGMKAYTVMHKCERVDSEEYETSENETVYGFPEEMTEAGSKEYEGFVAENFEQKEIASDGSTQVEIFYKRIRTTLTFNANGGAFSDGSKTKTLEGKFGAKVEIENPVWENTDFLGWGAELPETFGIESKEFSARWKSLIVEATHSTVYDMIISCGNLYRTYTIKLKGPIMDSTFDEVARALYENKRISFILDISEANGITELRLHNFPHESDICTNLVGIVLNDEIKTIEYTAFENFVGLKSVEIPDSVTSIRVYAFKNCTSLTSVTIPSSVTEIGGSAFEGCTNLQEANICDGVKLIGNSAFKNCTSLTSVTIPGSVTEIGGSAFEGCTNLQEATICNGVELIGGSAFKNCTSLTSVSIPSSVTAIDSFAFDGCTSLTSVMIPNSVTEIDMTAFYGCTSLEEMTLPLFDSLYIPSSLKKVTITGGEIVGSAFIDCTNLQEVNIFNGVKLIGGAAFADCTSLTSVTIPDSVTEIGWSAFNGCTSLETATFTDTNGWRYYTRYDKTSSESADVTDAATNATNLKSDNGWGRYGMFKE